MGKNIQKLMIIQQKLNAPKDKRNSFGGYNYRSCESILEAVKPLLSEVGATIVIKDTIELIGNRFYIKATASLYDVENGELISESTAYAREEEEKKGMDAAQLTGATSSYARKYALNGLFAIDDSKDADTDEYKKQQEAAQKENKPATKPAPKPATPQLPQMTAEQRELFDQLCADIDNAETFANLQASVSLALGMPFESIIRAKANETMKKKGIKKPNA